MDFSIIDILLLLLAGALGGFMSGLLGIGGGIIFIPILDFAFKRYGIHSDDLVMFIVANSLFIIMFTGLLNSYKQYRIKNFFPKQIFATAIPAIATGLLTTYLIKSGTWYSKEKFNLVFLALLTPLIFRMLYTRKKVPVEGSETTSITKFSIAGFFTGIVTALSGLGGGVIMVPTFTDILKVDIKKATSVSAGVVALIALSLSIGNLSTSPGHEVPIPHFGFIAYSVVIPIIIGTFFAVSFGVTVSQRTPSPVVKTIFALFSLLVIAKVVYETFF